MKSETDVSPKLNEDIKRSRIIIKCPTVLCHLFIALPINEVYYLYGVQGGNGALKQFLLIRKIAEKSQIVDKSYSSGNYAAELRQRPGPRRGAGRCWSENRRQQTEAQPRSNTCTRTGIDSLIWIIGPEIEILYYKIYENYDIAIAMSSSRADPVLGHCPGWGYLNI